MSNFHDSMWATASRDHTAEAHDRAVAMSSVALAGLTPFLFAASSVAEYDERLALVADRASQLLSAVTPDLLAHSAALTQSRSDFETLHMARVAARLESSFRTVSANLRTTAGDSVRISQKPECDVCKHLEGREGVPADYDARLPGLGGKWGNVCTPHFNQYGPGQTGTGHAQKFETEAARPKGDPYTPLAADLYCADCGHGSHAHGNGVCKGCERDGNHDPKHDSVRPNLQPGMSGWETMMSASLDGKTAVNLSNVGIVDKAGLVCKGTDPSGKVVKFKVTDAEMKQLSTVLYGDLAMNLSGVSVEQSDIISEASAKKAYTGARHNDGSGAFVVQVAGSGEHVWSQNALSFDTEDEAKAYASDLMGRWMGADMARVVPTSTPKREAVDPSDPAIVVNYRTGSLKTAASSWDDVKPGDKIRIGHEENAKDGIFVRLEKKDDADPIYKGQRFVVYTDTPGGPERKAGLTSFQGQEEAPRPARTAALNESRVSHPTYGGGWASAPDKDGKVTVDWDNTGDGQPFLPMSKHDPKELHYAAKTAGGGSSDLDDMISWEEGSLDEDDTIALFQRLIDTWQVWRLQGAYGRQAQALIDAGLCHQPGRGASKTAGGDGSGICGTCKQPISQQDYAWYHHTNEDRAAQKGHEPHPFPHKESASDGKGEKCWDCAGTGKVPSLGGDDPDDVDMGYVDCPTCDGSGRLTKKGARIAVVPPFVRGAGVSGGDLASLIASLSDEDVLEAEAALDGANAPLMWSGPNPYGVPYEPRQTDADMADKDRLFPDGVPLRGDLSDEQQAWLNKRGAAAVSSTCPTCKGSGSHPWDAYKKCPKCKGSGRNPKFKVDPDVRDAEASLHTAAVKCAKCTAGATPDGANCGYCDGAGSLDATMAMIKAADGWDQGITAQSFLRTARTETPADVLQRISDQDPDGQTDQPTDADYDAFEQHVKDFYGPQAWLDYHSNWGDSDGDRDHLGAKDPVAYSAPTTPRQMPKKPWADADEYDRGHATQKELDEGRAGRDRGLPKGMTSVEEDEEADKEYSAPNGRDGQWSTSSLTKEADIAALRGRLTALSGQQVSLTYTTDFGVTSANGQMTFADGNATVTSANGTVVSVPVTHVMGVESTGWSDVDPAAGEVDVEPGFLNRYVNWAMAGRHMANPFGGPGMPGLPPGSSETVAPQTTRPRVAPSSDTYTPEAYPSSISTPTHRVGPVDRTADTVEVDANDREARLVRARKAFTSPPKISAREAKVREIAASVLSTNPGLGSDKALSIAEATVERYDGVVKV